MSNHLSEQAVNAENAANRAAPRLSYGSNLRSFHWQSQNATNPTSKRGDEIIRHAA